MRTGDFELLICDFGDERRRGSISLRFLTGRVERFEEFGKTELAELTFN